MNGAQTSLFVKLERVVGLVSGPHAIVGDESFESLVDLIH
jgi:hypothetical protein